jgi:hypothetical protein
MTPYLIVSSWRPVIPWCKGLVRPPRSRRGSRQRGHPRRTDRHRRTVCLARNRQCQGSGRPQDSRASTAVQNRPTARWERSRDSVAHSSRRTDRIHSLDIHSRHARSDPSSACSSRSPAVVVGSTLPEPAGTPGSRRATQRPLRRSSTDGGSPDVSIDRTNSRVLASTAPPPWARSPGTQASLADRLPCYVHLACPQVSPRLRSWSLLPARLLRRSPIRPSPWQSSGRHRRPTWPSPKPMQAGA